MISTKSAGGIVERNGLIIVVDNRGTSISFPKGHIEKGEDEESAARREVHEESGVDDLILVKKLGSYKRYSLDANGKEDRSEMKNITLFLFKTKQTELKPVDKENPRAFWVEKDKVSEVLTHSKDKEFFLKIKNKI
jgi:8-oxo-dGTP pyrophosphatase MutT (NUDIX family)